MPAPMHKEFPIKVWCLTILLGPALLILYAFLTAFDSSKQSGIVGFYLYAVALGGLFSFPAFSLAYFAFTRSARWIHKAFNRKIIFFLVAVTGMIGTFYYFLREEVFSYETPFIWTYLAALILATAFCKTGIEPKSIVDRHKITQYQ